MHPPTKGNAKKDPEINQNLDQSLLVFQQLKSNQQHQSKLIRTAMPISKGNINISYQSRFHYSVSLACFWSANYRRMKYPLFKVKFLQEKIIIERREMAHSIHLEKVYLIRQ